MGLYKKLNFMSFRLNPPAGGGMPESPNLLILSGFRDKRPKEVPLGPGMTHFLILGLLIQPHQFSSFLSVQPFDKHFLMFSQKYKILSSQLIIN